jgi:hypothetical protein
VDTEKERVITQALKGNLDSASQQINIMFSFPSYIT